MKQFLEGDISSDEKKRMEAETWRGPTNRNLPLTKFHQLHTKKWNDNLLMSVFQKDFLHGQTMLNVGGGNGKEAEFLLSHGADSVVLIDIAQGQLTSAKLRIKQHQLQNLELLLCDAESLPIKNKRFGIGLIFFALHHFPFHENAVTELCRVSEKVLIIDIMNCGLTRLLNKFGFFLKEGNLIVNRVNEDTIQQFLLDSNFSFTIHYYFIPPYYGNNRIIIAGIRSGEKIVNFLISKNRFIAKFFGNVAIIEGIE
jgi:16S rRNA G966 N2-methylase RsmD